MGPNSFNFLNFIFFVKYPQPDISQDQQNYQYFPNSHPPRFVKSIPYCQGPNQMPDILPKLKGQVGEDVL
ncbi:hypothetical protein CDL12_27678 [Handroanthus impetiginosus]|uniref:Uncharacterized protein n=1 Tax=Handroanthus impetiginosus TaxID=429701 RepID=A0A2G9G3D1_9LAMI|nr:hypothetical protein CDL12_27678 [Handroanthus impetiginosus]